MAADARTPDAPDLSQPPRSNRGALLLASAIVLLAAILRLWNIDAGIPHSLAQDEPHIMERAVAMMKTGDFHPRFFDWPSLTIYLHVIVAVFTFLVGSMRGAWSSLDGVSADDLYLTGRWLTAALGAATVALTYAAGRRWGTRPALLAAALMAVIPHHVRESHYVLTDVPVAFFTTLTLLCTLQALEGRRAFFWAGIAAGLAASCKYNGLMAIVMPLIGAWAAGGGVVCALQRTVLILAAATAAFVAGTPYAILDLPFFLNDYADLAATFATERTGASGSSLYLKHLTSAFGWPAFIAVIAGLALGGWQLMAGPGRARIGLLLAFALVYFFVMAGGYQIYGRYVLPLLPVGCLLAATAVTSFAGLLGRRIPSSRLRMLAIGALVAAVIAEPAWRGVTFSHQLGRPTTVDAAYAWILEHIPAGSVVAVEAGAMRLPATYRSIIVTQLTQRARESYDADGVQYFLAASPVFQGALDNPLAQSEAAGAYRALLAGAVELAAFDASAERTGPSMRLYRVVR